MRARRRASSGDACAAAAAAAAAALRGSEPQSTVSGSSFLSQLLPYGARGCLVLPALSVFGCESPRHSPHVSCCCVSSAFRVPAACLGAMWLEITGGWPR
jgi:hypothetical protein